MKPDSERTTARRVVPTFAPDPDGAGGTLVLRDGARLRLRRALAEDAGRLTAFLGRLTEDEREQVAESLGLRGAELGSALASTGSVGREAFFVEGSDDPSVVGLGLLRFEPGFGTEARVSLAVDPGLRDQGVATLLLERLAVLAARYGAVRVVGVARVGNRAMIELFRRGGFSSRRRDDEGGVELSLDATVLARGAEGLAGRVFSAASLRPLFRPESVAVIGASRGAGSVGRRVLEALIQGGFQGPVFPVNPRARAVASVRAVPSVAAIGETVDLAILTVPSALVPAVARECADAGVRALIVITAGFAEVGGEGVRAQEELLGLVRERGLRIVGPNCLGLLHTDPDVRLNASFAPHMPPRGSVALCSQSGALGVTIIALARRLGLGLSAFVSVGNKADVSGNDLLEWWEEDPATRVVLFYLESFGNPRRFARIARRVGRSKPIVAVKAGRSSAGRRAASSHTAALSSGDTPVEALLHQTGVIRADTLQEMFGIARVLVDQPAPRGRRVCVVTNAGGPGILCVDALSAADLDVEPLSDATRARLAEFLPAAASTGNPVDMIASAGPDAYRRAVEILLAAAEVDALVVIYTPTGMIPAETVEEAILDGVSAGRAAGGVEKPVLASLVGADREIHHLSRDGEVVPVFQFPEEIGRVLGKVSRYADWRRTGPGLFPVLPNLDTERARALCRGALAERGAGWLPVETAREVLRAVGLPVAPGGVARGADEAVEIARDVGFPVACAIASLDVVHKSDQGFVELGLGGESDVRAAWQRIEERAAAAGAELGGVLVQPMIAGGTEVMIGVDVDATFGPMIAFGLGGVHVEILRDVVFRVAPLTDRDAREMVGGIRGSRLFDGYRGHPPADRPALEDALLRVSALAEAVPEIRELDLNPLFALPPGEGARIVDVRIRVEGEPDR